VEDYFSWGFLRFVLIFFDWLTILLEKKLLKHLPFDSWEIIFEIKDWESKNNFAKFNQERI
jgi:hypothetical protein